MESGEEEKEEMQGRRAGYKGRVGLRHRHSVMSQLLQISMREGGHYSLFIIVIALSNLWLLSPQYHTCCID